jgi:uncharacterized protein (TIGR02594 family)
MNNLPAQYAWLATLATAGTLPKTIQVGLTLLGTAEVAGPTNNPVIMAWVEELGVSWYKQVYTSDAVPWCGLAAGIVAKRAGKVVPVNCLAALAWAGFGEHSPEPSLGDCLVFTRKGGGHVGWYVGEDATAYHVLGGNQGDRFCIARVLKSQLYTCRRPVYSQAPASVKPYHLASSGAVAKSLA